MVNIQKHKEGFQTNSKPKPLKNADLNCARPQITHSTYSKSPTYEPSACELQRLERGLTCPVTRVSPHVWRGLSHVCILYELLRFCVLYVQYCIEWASLVPQMVKNLPVMQGTQVQSWVRKMPWRREVVPTPVFLPGEFHGLRRLAGYSPWGCRVRHDWVTNTFTFTV